MPTPLLDPLASVHQLSAAFAADATGAETLTRAFLERIERHDERLHAFVAVYADQAISAARAADLARGAGHQVGPLHGIPVAVKDIVDMEGRITTGGSKVWAQRVSPVTATLVTRMQAAGMIVLGKTHTVEFAMGSFGTNSHMGSPRNPWDSQAHRAPGGSSAGSAVAVAAGFAPWAIGTDTGGSVRIPSAWCGLTGLKTSVGRISTHGVLPLSFTLDTPGPMCRNAEDAATLFCVLAGPDDADPKTHTPPPLPTLSALRAEMARGVAGLRIAVMPESERDGVDAQVLSAFDESIEQLRSLGAQLETVELPARFQDLGARLGDIIGAEGYYFVGDLADDPNQPVDDHVRPRIQVGKSMSARHYVQRLREQAEVKRGFDSALTGFDALLTPTVATPAPQVERIDQSGTAAGFTRPFNFVEYCALALPNGQTDNGLPTSLQIVCPSYQESMALRIGAAYQNATQWHCRWPEL